MRYSWIRSAFFCLMAVTLTACAWSGQVASPQRLAGMRNVVVVSLVGDTVEFQTQSFMAGLIGISPTVSEVKVDWGLKKLAANDVAHTLSPHFNVIAAAAPDNPSAATAKPNTADPTLQDLRALGIEASDQVDTYVIIHPMTLAAAGPSLLIPASYAWTGLVAMSGAPNPSLFEYYTVTVMDARTGETFASGKPLITKPALGKSGPFIICDPALWPENLPTIGDAQRQLLSKNFATLLNMSLPWALESAGLISEAEAAAQETAAKDFDSCHQMPF